jgi:hypothetical protein
MLRNLQAFVVLGVWAVARIATAEEATEETPTTEAESTVAEATPPDEPPPEAATEPVESPRADEPPADASASAEMSVGGASATVDTNTAPASPADGAEPEADEQSDDWDTFLSGYFRAPFAIGISPRPSPDDPDGAPVTQFANGPNRTVDANFYSFAYTRLQEQDWGEMFIHAK